MNNYQQMEQNKRPLEEDTNYQEEEWPNKRFRPVNAPLLVGLLLKNRDAGMIIGKGGQNINAIRRDTGAVVNIQKQIPNSFERVADISGTVEQVSQAAQLIATSVSPDNPSIVLLVEARNLGPVIGKGGATISQIRNNTQANIHIGNECIGGSTQKEIRITGEYGPVHEAIKAVIAYLAEGRSPVRMPYVPQGGGGNFGPPGPYGQQGGGGNYGPPGQYRGGPGGARFNQRGDTRQQQGGPAGNSATAFGVKTEMVIMVPNDIIGKIIGRGGSSINQIRSQSGATILVAPKEDSLQGDRKITITGERQSRNMACTMIESMVTSPNNGSLNQQPQMFDYNN